MTKDAFCCNKSMLRQNFCHDKIMFVATCICHDKSFVMTTKKIVARNIILLWHKTFVVRNIILLQQKLLLWQAYFCRDKMCPFSSKLVVLSLQNLWFVDTVLWLGPSQLTKCYNTVISAHLNAESVWWWQRSYTHPPTLHHLLESQFPPAYLQRQLH